MATPSSRSFDQYSGLNQQKLNQPGKTPNAQQRLGDPKATSILRNSNPSALGLSERGAVQSGRSFYDPARQAERWVRGTGSQDQTQAAETLQRINDMADPVAAARRMSGRGLAAGAVAGTSTSVGAPVIPPTVADPGAAPTPVQAPSIFNQSMNNPAMAQSNALIGRALSRSGLNTQKAPFRSGTSTVLGPQTFL
jgi:hypothetical protein